MYLTGLIEKKLERGGNGENFKFRLIEKFSATTDNFLCPCFETNAVVFIEHSTGVMPAWIKKIENFKYTLSTASPSVFFKHRRF